MGALVQVTFQLRGSIELRFCPGGCDTAALGSRHWGSTAFVWHTTAWLRQHYVMDRARAQLEVVPLEHERQLLVAKPLRAHAGPLMAVTILTLTSVGAVAPDPRDEPATGKPATFAVTAAPRRLSAPAHQGKAPHPQGPQLRPGALRQSRAPRNRRRGSTRARGEDRALAPRWSWMRRGSALSAVARDGTGPTRSRTAPRTPATVAAGLQLREQTNPSVLSLLMGMPSWARVGRLIWPHGHDKPLPGYRLQPRSGRLWRRAGVVRLFRSRCVSCSDSEMIDHSATERRPRGHGVTAHSGRRVRWNRCGPPLHCPRVDSCVDSAGHAGASLYRRAGGTGR
jgi:hypothetical protein